MNNLYSSIITTGLIAGTLDSLAAIANYYKNVEKVKYKHGFSPYFYLKKG